MGKRKKVIKIVGLVALIAALFVTGFFTVFYYAYEGTPDGKRISTETNLKMVVNLPGVKSTPSRAITETYYADEYNSFSKAKRTKIMMRTSGKVEGDIPCVYVETKEKSKIEFLFQDLDYNNIVPEVKEVNIYRYSWPPQEGIEIRHEDFSYEVSDGKIIIYAIDFVEKDAIEDDSENGVFEIKYKFNGKEYISISAVNVLKDESDPFED